ncbi:MAG: hypothetical protein A2Y31_05530 [Spirochaetes bacterium GWC2_52_13]|nr:MAG: hypothetical protein A2Y31_05530 [Spirochaetes bacterium GWC2_52_13]
MGASVAIQIMKGSFRHLTLPALARESDHFVVPFLSLRLAISPEPTIPHSNDMEKQYPLVDMQGNNRNYRHCNFRFWFLYGKVYPSGTLWYFLVYYQLNYW